jgi:hypothetical protein
MGDISNKTLSILILTVAILVTVLLSTGLILSAIDCKCAIA